MWVFGDIPFDKTVHRRTSIFKAGSLFENAAKYAA